MKKTTINTLALSSSLAMAVSGMAYANENPFNAEKLDSGYETKAGEGKCGGKHKIDCETLDGTAKTQCLTQTKQAEGKCGEGKCGEGKCGGSKAATDGKTAEGKCGEGKCGGSKAATDGKTAEGKCGEGKCGGSK